MTYETCGIGRCKNSYDGIVWSVPICDEHWRKCCKEHAGCSLGWLHEKARKEFASKLPEPPAPAVPAPVADEPKSDGPAPFARRLIVKRKPVSTT